MTKHITIILTCLAFCIHTSAQQRHFTIADGLHNNQVRQIIELPGGQMFVVSEGAFSIYDGNRFQPVYCCPDSILSLPSFGCHAHMWKDDNTLLIKDYYSLYIFDAHAMRFRYDYPPLTTDSRVKAFTDRSDQPRILECTDRQGGRWVVDEKNGINYYSPFPVKGTTLSLDILTPGDHIRHIAAVSDTELLMASAEGIFLFDTKAGKVTRTLASGQIHSSNINLSTNNKNAWISTKQGLYLYADGTMRHYNTSNTTGFLHDHMRFAQPIDRGRILVCNLLHLLGYFYPEQGRFQLLNDNLPELNSYRTMIDACQYDDNGKMLVATQNGIFVLDTRNNRTEHPSCLKGMAKHSNKFNCLLRDSQKRIWIGSQNGLFVLIPQLSATGTNKSFTLRHLSTADGLSNTCIKSIVEDTDGNIFAGTAYGVNRVTVGIDRMTVTAYGVSDGIPELEICERGMCIMPHGHLYLATDESLVQFDTSKEDRKAQPLQVRLVGVAVNDSLWTPCQGLSLAYDQNSVTLRLSSLNYANPSHTRYRYRLLGANGTWTTVKDGKDIVTAQYHSLPPGKYTFEIQATEDNNPWGAVTTFPITIQPPLWQTWWAITLYILCAVLISYKLISLYLNHRKKIMEAENEKQVNRLFELQSQARHQFAQNTNVTAEKLADSTHEKLISQMNKAIADNMDNCDYTVDDLAKDVGMSRASLYKKSQQALGITPNDYLRNVRLKHATTLLEQGIPVNQVSLMVGFMTPRYFSQCFKSLFGVSPSEYSDSSKS